MKNILLSAIWFPAFANDNDAYIPEQWAAESLIILENNTVASKLVHRDFSNEIQTFGDVVNTRRPEEFVSRRKTDADNVTVQDAISNNVQVPLNQHLHVSFTIKDGERSKSFKDLMAIYLEPAMIAMADGLDQIVVMQGYQLLANTVGQLGTPIDKSTMIALDELFNDNRVPMANRNIIVPPSMKADLLEVDDFTHVDKIAPDGGIALRTAQIGPLLSFNTWMDQNAPHPSTPVSEAGAINNAAGYAAGATVLTVDGFASAIITGSWLVIDGDGTPQQVQSTVGGGTPTSVTLLPGLKRAVADNAVVSVYQTAAINNGGGYAAGYAKDLAYDTVFPAVAPSKGAIVSGATGFLNAPIYGFKDTPSLTASEFDRPLASALADNAALGIGPAGAYGMAWHRNALALVSRPLAEPMSGVGAQSAVVNMGDLSVRVTMTYNGLSQGHLVTVDMLLGVALLDSRLGAVVLGS